MEELELQVNCLPVHLLKKTKYKIRQYQVERDILKASKETKVLQTAVHRKGSLPLCLLSWTVVSVISKSEAAFETMQRKYRINQKSAALSAFLTTTVLHFSTATCEIVIRYKYMISANIEV